MWETATVLATYRREMYEAYLRAGFGEQQALWLTAASGPDSLFPAPDSDGEDNDPNGDDDDPDLFPEHDADD